MKTKFNRSPIDTIVFDLGGVLIDWNPAYVYRNHFDDPEEMEWFLNEVCNSSWNTEQDAGRSFHTAEKILIKNYPKYEAHIKAYFIEWEKMLNGMIPGMEALFNQLEESTKINLFALTNWSAETFPLARKYFSFLNKFEGIVVSGEEKVVKPDPQIYRILMERYQINPENAIFIDDMHKNVVAAAELGFHAIHFQGEQDLRKRLEKLIGLKKVQMTI